MTEYKGVMINAVNAYEEERAKYLGGAVYYPNNQKAFEGCMRKALQAIAPPNLAEEIEALEKYKGKTNSTVLHAAKVLLEASR